MALIVLLAIYFLPWIIAAANQRPNAKAIFLTNLLLGWTLIGWIAVMVWAFKARTPVSQVKSNATSKETEGDRTTSVSVMRPHPAMSFRPSTPKECEGFQMLGSGICCATCEWTGDECPFGRNGTAHPSNFPTLTRGDARLSAAE